jgi:hypothetical protein
MVESYKISATPSLYSEGEYKGKLKSITFTAVSQNDTRQWYARNCGHFEAAFSKIMPASVAKELVTRLTQGDNVEFPGAYPEHEFAQGFLFEWSPVHLVLPPIFFPEEEPA